MYSIGTIKKEAKKELLDNKGITTFFSRYIIVVTLIALFLAIVKVKVVNYNFQSIFSLDNPYLPWANAFWSIIMELAVFPLYLGIYRATVKREFCNNSIFYYYKTIKRFSFPLIIFAIVKIPFLLLNGYYDYLKISQDFTANYTLYSAFLIILMIGFIGSVLFDCFQAVLLPCLMDTETSFLKTVKTSLKIAINNIGSIILFKLSFALWYIASFVILLFLGSFRIENLSIVTAALFTPMIFGIGFGFLPYYTLSNVKYIQAMRKDYM